MAIRREIHGGDDSHRRVTVVDQDAPVHEETTSVVNEDVHAHTSAGEEEYVSSYPGGWSMARAWMHTFNLMIGFLLLVVETLLAFRLVFGLAGANPAAGFVNFIYDASAPLVAPFENIANERVLEGNSVFEPETVVAMLVYAVAALLIIALVNVVTSAPPPQGERSMTRRSRSAHYDEEM